MLLLMLLVGCGGVISLLTALHVDRWLEGSKHRTQYNKVSIYVAKMSRLRL